MTLEENVKSIIAGLLGIRPEEATLQSVLIDDLGADSLDLVELVMALEEEFDIEIPDEEIGEINSVKDVIKYVEGKVANRETSFNSTEVKKELKEKIEDIRKEVRESKKELENKILNIILDYSKRTGLGVASISIRPIFNIDRREIQTYEVTIQTERI